MHDDWLQDGRKIPDDVIVYLRKLAVNAVRERGESPEVVARIYNFNRHCIYDWLRKYDRGGYAALESVMPAGASRVITEDMDNWLKETVLDKTPLDFGYDTHLWTGPILAELLKKKFNIVVSDDSVGLHLKAMGFTFQTPCYQDMGHDAEEVERFLNDKFVRIKRLAEKLGADIGFEDETGVGVRTRSGRTWGLRGKTPIVRVSNQHGGYNILSIVTPQGEMRYSMTAETVNSHVYIEFLKHLMSGRERPLILLVDHATFHGSKEVRDFVRAHRTQIRIFFLPKHAPELNPAEQVWNDVKNNRIGKQPVKNKLDLKQRLKSELASLQKNAKRILSFFQLEGTKYAAAGVV